jgi:hypothetical protein
MKIRSLLLDLLRKDRGTGNVKISLLTRENFASVTCNFEAVHTDFR